MELMMKYLCCALFLHAVSSELDGDVVFDIVSRRLDHISITLSRIARKQKVIEQRLNDQTVEGNEPQRNLGTSSDFTKDWLEDELAAMKKAIASEKEFVRNLVGSLEMKMETKTDTQATSNGLESRVEALENTIAEQTIPRHLQSRMESMEKNLDSVETLSDGLEDRIELVERKLDSVETTSGGIESRMDSVESSVSSLILASGRKVSFSVQYRPPSGTDATRFKKQRIIRFNHVFYNDGSGYNETTGIFNVPVSGVYQFIFFVEGWQLKDDFICQAAIVALYVDGSSAGTAAVADPRHKTQHMQAGNAYINYFRKGQKVLVATASTCDEYIIFGYRTTFNGVLLY